MAELTELVCQPDAPVGGSQRESQPRVHGQAGGERAPANRLPGHRPAAPRSAEAPAGSEGVLVDEQQQAGEPIAIRDVRGEHSFAATGEREGAGNGREAPPWLTAVQRALDAHRQSREPFAVLLVELLDAERLPITQPSADAVGQVREAEAAMVERLRPADTLMREADGRYWLIAPDTDAPLARAVTSALAEAVRRAGAQRGAQLEIAVGIALCPDHGLDSAALVGHAEVDLFAAQATGLSGASGQPPLV